MKKTCRSILVFALLAVVSVAAQATTLVPIPGLTSTGTATPGNPDPVWVYAYSPTPISSGFVFNQAQVTSDAGYPFPYWIANSTNSRWISPQTGYGAPFGTYDDPVGYYYFQLSFNIGAGYIPSTGTFSFQLSTDNWLNSVWLNGTYIGTGYEGDYVLNHTYWTNPVTVGPGPSSGLQSGLNNLVVVVYNKAVGPGGTNPSDMGTWNPAGLRLEILSSQIQFEPPSGEIPEPGTLFLLGSGLLAIGFVQLRRS